MQRRFRKSKVGSTGLAMTEQNKSNSCSHSNGVDSKGKIHHNQEKSNIQRWYESTKSRFGFI